MSPKATFRPIQAKDNPPMAGIIREVMTEFKTVGPGYSIEDPEVDHLLETYSEPGHVYWVAEEEGRILGGGGIAPLAGGAPGTCELRKMYFLPEARGRGLGKQLVEGLLKEARRLGYTQCYLETVARMQAANGLYQKFGFQLLDHPMGNTGHRGCERYYLLVL